MSEISNIDLIRSFSQGEVKLPNSISSVGNCASIALIKASIEVFGLNKVIDYFVKDDVYFVTLKNAVQLEFTKSQLERCNTVANFQLNSVDPGKFVLYKSIFEYAQILMCTMTVMVSKIGECGDGIGDFESALIAINDGANCTTIPKLLGLENYYIGKTKMQRFFMSPNNIGMYAWLTNHTVYMSEELYDYHGKVKYIPNRYPNRIRIVDAKQNT
jgi:hypothetical protein